ncbi:N-acetyltransferase [Streptomyces sp. NPDC004647]|uniref:GNAT family N-acetyltransferase n=1 Tax=Streptomyces sp. NPDC004647 TaxID=3154671 RepID=UPI0033AD1BA4
MTSPLDVTVRPYTAADEPAVLELVNADRIPGQPAASSAMLAEALNGRSRVDASWWQDLETPQTQVAVNAAGNVVGVISYAIRPKDREGLILWLHCRESPTVADALVSDALTYFGPRTVHAFHIASALTMGLEALPVRHRPVTHDALNRAGFSGLDLWRYMRADLPARGLPQLTAVTIGPSTDDKDAQRLEVRERGKTIAEAVVGRPVEGIGVLWWIEVQPSARGRGLGRAMLGTAMEHLATLGAAEVVLYVDDDAPPGNERDRTAANSLYESAGFLEVDRLYSYTRHSKGER